MNEFYHIFHDKEQGDTVVRYYAIEGEAITWGLDYLEDDAELFGKLISEIPNGLYASTGEPLNPAEMSALVEGGRNGEKEKSESQG